MRPTLHCCFVLLVLSAVTPPATPCFAQNVNYTERHARLRKAAANIVQGLGNRQPKFSLSPRLEVCNEGHYHFRVGRPGIYCESFWELGEGTTDDERLTAIMMDARLTIEWFWKDIPAWQQTFWTPYIVEAAKEIEALEKAVDSQAELDRRTTLLLFPARMDAIWVRGATEFARVNNLELKLEKNPGAPCAAAAPVMVTLIASLPTPNTQLSHIEWSPAAPVWRAMIDGREPTSYQTVLIGGEKEVNIGALYYYRFIVNNRPTKERLAPEIPVRGGLLSLPFSQ